MNNTNVNQEWIPTADELAERPSIGLCHGCGAWADFKDATCSCWTNPDQERRQITASEFVNLVLRYTHLIMSIDEEQRLSHDESQFIAPQPD